MKQARQFHVPNASMWIWKLVSPVFIRLQLERAQNSYQATENARGQIEPELKSICKEIWREWGTASVNRMHEFMHYPKEMSPEVRPIRIVRLSLRTVIDEMEV